MKFLPITEICDFQGGTQPPKNEWSDKPMDGYIRMLQIRDFTQSERTTPEFVKNSKNLKTCNSDDVLIGRYGASIGKILTGHSGAYNVAIVKAIPNEKLLNKKFLLCLLRSPSFQNFITTIGARAAQAGFNKSDLTQFNIPILPIEDQIRIAHLLGKVEGLIAQRKQHLQKLDDLLKSVFLEMFGFRDGTYTGWPSGKLDNYTDVASGVTKGKKHISKDLIEVPYMRVANVQDGHFVFDEVKTIAVTRKEVSQYQLLSGDLLLTEGGDPDKLGRGSVWKEEIPNCIHQNHIFRVRIKSSAEINPHFLSALISSSYGKKYFIKSAKQTTGIASINSSQLKNFPTLTPPINLQNQFASIIEKIGGIKSRYQQSLAHLESLYGTLSQRAFKGELDLSQVPLPNIEPNNKLLTALSEVAPIASPPKDFELPTTKLMLKELNNPRQTNDLLHFWLDSYCAQLGNAKFTAQEFMDAAQKRLNDELQEIMDGKSVSAKQKDKLAELYPNNEFVLTSKDYDTIKKWIFDQLGSASLKQTRNTVIANNKRQFGNEILLRPRMNKKQ